MNWKYKLLWRRGLFDTIEIAARFLFGKLIGKPVSFMIEPTHLCNLRCSICYTQNVKLDRKKDFMSFGEFKRIIDNIRYHCVYVSLWFAGEPLLNNELEEMIVYARDKNMITCISTNATLLDASKAENLVTAELDRIIISLDGATKESYEKIRKGAVFEKVIENIKYLTSCKKHPFVSLQMVVTKENENEIEQFKKLAEDLKVDEAYIKSLYTFDYSKEISEKLKSQNPSNENKRNIKEKYCTAKKRNVICADGSVLVCCFDVLSQYKFGNIFEESFSKIWNKQSYKEFRNDTKRFTESKLCSTCGCMPSYIIKRLK